MLATLFVAEGKPQKLERLILTYRDEDDARYGQAKNRKLVESISGISFKATVLLGVPPRSQLPVSALGIDTDDDRGEAGRSRTIVIRSPASTLRTRKELKGHPAS